MRKIPICLTGNDYEIIIERGCLQGVGTRIEKEFNPSSVHIITDRVVESLHLKNLLSTFALPPKVVILPEGEKTKSLASYGEVCSTLLKRGVDRDSVLMAFGGGVIGDFTGFVASTLLRGIRFIQIPTTLLSQVDSSIGGKTGINTPEGKNLLGSFYHPKKVYMDPEILDTLGRDQMKNGYAEILKSALILDQGFFAWLEEKGKALLNRESPILEEAIHRSCLIKAKVVQEDEKELGLRALLNFGHTFGHAFEALSDYSVLHGEAVSVGILFALYLAEQKGLTPRPVIKRIKDHMRDLDLPTNLSDLKLDHVRNQDILDLLLRDKKAKRSKMSFVFLRDIGEAFVEKGISEEEIRRFLEAQRL